VLAAIIEGQATPTEIAELSKGRLCEKRDLLAKALEGRVKAHHQFVLIELLGQIDTLDEIIARFDEQIQEYCRPFEAVVELLDTIPRVGRPTAEIIVAEIGTDLSRFESADHLVAWAGVAPENNESAGKQLSGKTRHGNKALGVAINQAAHAVAHMKKYVSVCPIPLPGVPERAKESHYDSVLSDFDDCLLHNSTEGTLSGPKQRLL
jgi:transposase